MTHTSVRWTHVLFSVGLTLVVAIAPMLFVFGFAFPVQAGKQLAVLGIFAAVAVATLLATIVIGTRAETR